MIIINKIEFEILSLISEGSTVQEISKALEIRLPQIAKVRKTLKEAGTEY